MVHAFSARLFRVLRNQITETRGRNINVLNQIIGCRYGLLSPQLEDYHRCVEFGEMSCCVNCRLC